MSDLATIDEVLAAPGEAEAEGIRCDYNATVAGLRSFVRMGFRLAAVKARLPHGKYLPWCDAHLSGLSRPVLFRAKSIAEGIAKCFHVETFDGLPDAAFALIDGHGGHRALLTTIQEFRHDELEAKNKALCEERWAKDPEARDEWEPAVLSGEVTYTYALRGMTGQELTGKARPRIDYNALISRNLTSLPKCWERWADLSDEARTATLNKLPESFGTAPLVVLHTLQRAIEKQLAAKHGKEGGQ